MKNETRKEARARRAKLDRRNELQRARRALPGAAAREAQASRRSYWRKRIGWGMCGGGVDCSYCARVAAEHGL